MRRPVFHSYCELSRSSQRKVRSVGALADVRQNSRNERSRQERNYNDSHPFVQSSMPAAMVEHQRWRLTTTAKTLRGLMV